MIHTASTYPTTQPKTSRGSGVFHISDPYKYCKELDGVIAVAKSKGYIIPTDYQLRQVNTYINELVSNGIWSKLDLFYLFGYGGENSIHPSLTFATNEPYRRNNLGDFSRINFVSPTNFELVRNTNGATTRASYPYHSKIGWKIGSGAANDNGYLSTQWVIGTNSVNWTQNNASISFYMANFAETTSTLIITGYADATPGSATSIAPSNGTNILIRINTSGAGANGVANTTVAGYYNVERTASNLTTVYKNGVSIGTTARLSSAVGTTGYPVYILAFNNLGTASSQFLYNPLSVIKYGASLGSTLSKTDYELFTTLRTKLGYQ